MSSWSILRAREVIAPGGQPKDAQDVSCLKGVWDMTANGQRNIAFALGGIGGSNAHGAGFLHAAAKEGRRPTHLSYTSGMIYWTWCWLEGCDLEQEFMHSANDARSAAWRELPPSMLRSWLAICTAARACSVRRFRSISPVFSPDGIERRPSGGATSGFQLRSWCRRDSSGRRSHTTRHRDRASSHLRAVS
jgi:hypothetical protein